MMVVSQVGGTVQGEVQGFPMAGTASGNALSFTGERIVDPCHDDWEGTTYTRHVSGYMRDLRNVVAEEEHVSRTVNVPTLALRTPRSAPRRRSSRRPG